jgi:hypothetical protein
MIPQYIEQCTVIIDDYQCLLHIPQHMFNIKIKLN